MDLIDNRYRIVTVLGDEFTYINESMFHDLKDANGNLVYDKQKLYQVAGMNNFDIKTYPNGKKAILFTLWNNMDKHVEIMSSRREDEQSEYIRFVVGIGEAGTITSDLLKYEITFKVIETDDDMNSLVFGIYSVRKLAY